jgi:hypothetical protein
VGIAHHLNSQIPLHNLWALNPPDGGCGEEFASVVVGDAHPTITTAVESKWRKLEKILTGQQIKRINGRAKRNHHLSFGF